MKLEKQFEKIVELIYSAREKAILSVNKELIELYWNIGSYISLKVSDSEWGMSVVKNLSDYINGKLSDVKGFSSQNLWRMKQFYETYCNKPKLSSLLRELSWTNNLMILSKTTSDEEREFYIKLAIQERYIKKEHEKPSVGIILCKSKDTQIVEYALSRTVSPTMIAKYEIELIDKKILENKLDEFFLLAGSEDE
jgi:predicted nuclease of restriction endonuclease-like (RecB) superfamily